MKALDELFPAKAGRELYDKAADVLLHVVCDIRFPRNLRIESANPTEFQEAVLAAFPLYDRFINVQLPPGVTLPPEILQQLATQNIPPTHQFKSEDKRNVLALTSESLNLSVQGPAYEKWEGFRELMQLAVKALCDNYKVPFFSRVGLRYTDVIHRETLGIENSTPWSKLISPDLLGRFIRDFEGSVTGANGRAVVTLPDRIGRLNLQYGLTRSAGKQGLGYRLDFDISDQPRIETHDAFTKLDQFHDIAGRAFRWAISDELRVVLGPRPL